MVGFKVLRNKIYYRCKIIYGVIYLNRNLCLIVDCFLFCFGIWFYGFICFLNYGGRREYLWIRKVYFDLRFRFYFIVILNESYY